MSQKKEHDYSIEKPTLREIHKDHFVYCSESEFQKYKKNNLEYDSIIKEALLIYGKGNK